MKLTNISLAILVALGLAACGGSDDNTPQTSDNQEAGHNNQTPTGGDGGNENTTPTTPTSQKSGLDPERVAPDLTVPKDLQTDVNVSKAAYLSRGFADPALGYFGPDGRSYTPSKGTDPANIKFTTVYNYSEAGDLVDSKSTGKYFDTTSEGAIYVGQDPTDGYRNNAFVKIKDKYYRVAAYVPKGKKYTPSTEFELVPDVERDGSQKKLFNTKNVNKLNKDLKKLYSEDNYAVVGFTNTGKKRFSQSEVVFIANAKIPEWKPKGSASKADKEDVNASLDVTLNNPSDFTQDTGQTVLQNVSFLGNEYNPKVNGQTLDFSKLPVNKDEIQFVDVSSTFAVTNNKYDSIGGNDFSQERKIDLGKLKAYNLPYSMAYVTVDPNKKSEKNIFNLDGATDTVANKVVVQAKGGKLNNGSYQVRGYQTIALPKQGRAHYYGKSFNETVEGDIKLTADFFEDRAGVQGTVTNRKDVVKDKALPNLRLDLLTLTDPETHGTFAQTDYGLTNKGKGKVYGDPKVSGWSVQFYGLEAQEAGGKLYHDTTGYQEVYTTQRGRLTNLSNTSDVK